MKVRLFVDRQIFASIIGRNTKQRRAHYCENPDKNLDEKNPPVSMGLFLLNFET